MPTLATVAANATHHSRAFRPHFVKIATKILPPSVKRTDYTAVYPPSNNAAAAIWNMKAQIMI